MRKSLLRRMVALTLAVLLVLTATPTNLSAFAGNNGNGNGNNGAEFDDGSYEVLFKFSARADLKVTITIEGVTVDTFTVADESIRKTIDQGAEVTVVSTDKKDNGVEFEKIRIQTEGNGKFIEEDGPFIFEIGVPYSDGSLIKEVTSWKGANENEPEVPDIEDPDPENPDPENPDPENPDPENPDPENPEEPNAPEISENNLPIANDDTHTVDENSGKQIVSVLGNDSDPDEDALTVTSVTTLTNLELVEGVLYYKPETNFDGTKTFEYTISDGNGGTDSAIVIITVNDTTVTPNQPDDDDDDDAPNRPRNPFIPTVNVDKVKITLDADPVEIEYGTEALEEYLSYDLTEEITGSDSKKVKWTIDDEEIATVNNKGVVTAVKQGETTVTVTHVESGETASSTVIVYLVGDEESPLGAVEFFDPYVYGYPDGSFGPERFVTRAEVATMFSKILKLNLDYPGSQNFSDVNDNTWYYNYVQAIRRTDIFVGDGDGNFRPNDPITRAEMATVFAKYWKYLNINVDDSAIAGANDFSASHWASSYIYMMYNAKVVSGFADGTYRPDEPTLREQVVVMINTLIARPPYPAVQSKFNDILNSHWAYGDIEAASQFYVVNQLENGFAIDN